MDKTQSDKEILESKFVISDNEVLASEYISNFQKKKFTIDTYENKLCMINYVFNETDNKFLEFNKYRGMLIDIKNKCVLTQSYNTTSYCIKDSLSFDDDQKLELFDVMGNKYKYDKNTLRIKPCYEGVLVRVIWYDGKMLIMTHKRVDADLSNSKLVNSKKFSDIYYDNGGPKAEELFDTTKNYSNTCYYFLLVDNGLTRVSLLKNSSFIAYLRKSKLNLPFLKDDEYAEGIENFKYINRMMIGTDKSFILKEDWLSLDEANQYLNKSNDFITTESFVFPGKELPFKNGDMLFICNENENGEISDCLEIHHSNYRFRFSILDDSYVRTSFSKLLDNISLLMMNKDFGSVKEKIAFFDIKYTKLEIVDGEIKVNKIKFLSESNINKLLYENKEYDNKINLFCIIYLNLLLSVNLSKVEECLNIMNFFHTDVNKFLTQVKYEITKCGINEYNYLKYLQNCYHEKDVDTLIRFYRSLFIQLKNSNEKILKKNKITNVFQQKLMAVDYTAIQFLKKDLFKICKIFKFSIKYEDKSNIKKLYKEQGIKFLSEECFASNRKFQPFKSLKSCFDSSFDHFEAIKLLSNFSKETLRFPENHNFYIPTFQQKVEIKNIDRKKFNKKKLNIKK